MRYLTQYQRQQQEQQIVYAVMSFKEQVARVKNAGRGSVGFSVGGRSVGLEQFSSINDAAYAFVTGELPELFGASVVLTQPNSTRIGSGEVLAGSGRTIIPVPVISPNPYAEPTGTVSRATFATSTVTTAQLAQRVAALIQDLQAVGILPTTT